jgi:hypothetical protein
MQVLICSSVEQMLTSFSVVSDASLLRFSEQDVPSMDLPCSHDSETTKPTTMSMGLMLHTELLRLGYFAAPRASLLSALARLCLTGFASQSGPAAPPAPLANPVDK